MSQYLKGDRELIAKLQSLKAKDAKAAIRRGTRAGAKIVQARAKQLAPRKTGLLVSSIKVRALPRSRKWVGTMLRTAFRGTKAFYGSFVELGTKFIKARHFLRTAAKDTGKAALATAVDTIRREIVARLAK